MILEFVGYDEDRDEPIDEAVKMDYMPRVGETILFTPSEEDALANEDNMLRTGRYKVSNVAHVINQKVNHSDKIPGQSNNKTAIIYVESQ